MAATALIATAFVIGVEQLMQWRYGPMGIVGLLLLAVGFRANHSGCCCAGAVLLALLVNGPAH